MKTDDPLPTARGEGEEGRESAFCKGENRVHSISFNFGKCTLHRATRLPEIKCNHGDFFGFYFVERKKNTF